MVQQEAWALCLLWLPGPLGPTAVMHMAKGVYHVHSGFISQLRNQPHLDKPQYYSRLLADSSNFVQEEDIIFVILVRNKPALC